MYYDDKYNDEIRRFESKQKEAIIAMAVCLDLIKYKNERNRRKINDIISNLKKSDLSQSTSLSKALAKELDKVDKTKRFISSFDVKKMLEEKGTKFSFSIDTRKALEMAEKIANSPDTALKHFVYDFNQARRDIKRTGEERTKKLEQEEERKRERARKKLEEEQRKHPYNGITDEESKRLLSEDIDNKLDSSDYRFSSEESARIRELYPQINYGNMYYSIDTLEKGMAIDRLSKKDRPQVMLMINIVYDVIDVVTNELLYNNDLSKPDIFTKVGVEKSLEKYKKAYDKYMAYYQSLTPEQRRKEEEQIAYYPDYQEAFGNHIATPEQIITAANNKIKNRMIKQQRDFFGVRAEKCFRVTSHATKYMEIEEIAELYKSIRYEFEKTTYWNSEDKATVELYKEYLEKIQIDFSNVILNRLEKNNKEVSFSKMTEAEKKAYYEEQNEKIAAICIDILKEQPLSSFLQDKARNHDLEGRGNNIKETYEAKETAKRRVYGLSTVKKAMAQISGKWSRYTMLMEKDELNKQEQDELVGMFR